MYTKDTLKSRRTDQFEEKGIENICLELNLRKVKWAIVAAYNPPNANNENFKNTIIRIVDKISLHYDDFIIIGDLNLIPTNSHLKTICSSFGLTNLIKEPTCYKPNCNPSSIDVILTNRKNHLKNSIAIESSLSDFHKLILTTLKSSLPKHHPKIQHYRDLSKFTEEGFCQDLLAAPVNIDKMIIKHSIAFIDIFSSIVNKHAPLIVNKHAPLKSKKVRANNKPLTKIQLKARMLRTKLKNIYNKHRTKDNFQKYKEQRNHCANLRQRVKSNYFTKICQEGMLDTRQFKNLIKTWFLENKCACSFCSE